MVMVVWWEFVSWSGAGAVTQPLVWKALLANGEANRNGVAMTWQ